MAQEKDNTASEAAAHAKKTVTIRIPRTSKEEDDVFVSVNQRTWLIKRGVEVDVPICVADVLKHQENMLSEVYEFEVGAQSRG